MVSFLFLLFIAVHESTLGEKSHEVRLSNVCDLNVNARVGDVVHWINPTNKTLYVMGERCHENLSLIIPPKQKSSHSFMMREVCKYRVNVCPEVLAVIRVKRRVERRSLNQASVTDCSAVRRTSRIADKQLSSAYLCTKSFDYAIRCTVAGYISLSGKDYINLNVTIDYHSNATGNTVSPSTSSKSLKLRIRSSGVPSCLNLLLHSEHVIMGYRSGTEFAIDRRTRARKWESKMRTKLNAYRRKVISQSCT